jgi:hypothetical protein
MDPLSVVAGVTGTIGFTLTIAQNLYDLIDKVKGAPKELQTISRHTHDLAGILSTLESLIVSNQDSFRQDDNITEVLRPLIGTVDGCRLDLTALVASLDGFGEGRSMSKWRTFLWPFKEKSVLSLADRVATAKATLSIALGTVNVLNNARVQNTTSHISRQIEEMRLEIRAQFEESVLPSQSHSQTTLLGEATDSGANYDLGFAMKRFLDDTTSVMTDLPGTVNDMDEPWSPVDEGADTLVSTGLTS